MQKSAAPTVASTYTFSSQPKPVNARRARYREPGELDTTMYRDPKETNISWDKRVHRGNTYSMYTQNAIKDAIEEAQQAGMMKPAPRRKQQRQTEASPFDTAMPEVERIPVDLTSNLVAKEQIIDMATLETQTDEFLPQPPPNQYEPQRVGIDVSTQVEDGELFNFDEEVEPILDVIVNKTLEQSVMEVEEEFELESMLEFKTEWYQRQEELAQDWHQQIEAEQALWQKKCELMKVKREEKKREALVLLKIQAIAAAKEHLRNVVPNAFSQLQEVSFPDKRGMAIDRLFFPNLMDQVRKDITSRAESEQRISSIVSRCVQDQAEQQRAAVQALKEKRLAVARRRLEDAQIRQGTIRINVDDGQGNKVPVGPIQVSSEETIETVQDHIFEWLQAHEPRLATSWSFGVILCINGEPCQSTAEIFEAKAGMISMVPKPEPPREEPEEGAEAEGLEDGADGEGEAT